MLLAGCEGLEETANGTRTFEQRGVPVTFEVPVDFTVEAIDGLNSSGDLVAGYGLSKVDVIALRRHGSAELPEGPQRHEVLGKDVTSELFEVAEGYAIECQYTDERADRVREACAETVASAEET